MRTFRILLLVAFAYMFSVATSHAQTTLTASFDFTCPSGNCAPGDTNPLSIVAPEGQISLTVLGNGTIAASLVDSGASAIYGFGFDPGVVNLPESGWSTTPDYAFGWGDNFGYQYSGFGDYVSNNIPSTESWIIGNPGDYTSVSQLMNGGNSSVNFVLLDSNSNAGNPQGEFGANLEGNYPVSAPEGGAALLYLLLAGGACFGAMFFSRSRFANLASA